MKLYTYYVVTDGKYYWCGDYNGEPMPGELNEAFLIPEDLGVMAIDAAWCMGFEVKAVQLSEPVSIKGVS